MYICWMNGLREDTLGPFKCESNIFNRGCKMRLILNIQEGRRRENEGDGEKNHNATGRSNEKPTLTDYT